MVAASKISDRKRRANRLNARKSTGPRTLSGKERSSQNARTHGVFCQDVVLEGEDAAEFNLIRRRFIERLRPQDLLELSLVERVAEGNWRLMRLNRCEADQECANDPSSSRAREEEQMMAVLATQMLGKGSGRLPAAAFRACEARSTVIDAYGPARQRVEQSIGRALRELRMLQSPSKPADLPNSPYLKEDPGQCIEYDDEREYDQPAENPQNEPTADASPASSDAHDGNAPHSQGAEPDRVGPDRAAIAPDESGATPSASLGSPELGGEPPSE